MATDPQKSPEGKSTSSNEPPHSDEPAITVSSPQTDYKLVDGDEDFNVIDHEEFEDVTDDDEQEGEEGGAGSAYRPGLAGLLGNRMMLRNRSQPEKFHHLHPFCQVLSLSNLDDACVIEDENFAENERCSREKFAYRLSTCPELSLGIFTRPKQTDAEKKSDPNPRHRLIAHIIATRTSSRTVTDASMDFPPNWREGKSSSTQSNEKGIIGHEDFGETLAVHSLAVAKDQHSKGLGTILLKAYAERMKSAKIVDRISLLAREDMAPFYQRFGFVNERPSAAKFGGVAWKDMVLDFGDQLED